MTISYKLPDSLHNMWQYFKCSDEEPFKNKLNNRKVMKVHLNYQVNAKNAADSILVIWYLVYRKYPSLCCVTLTSPISADT